LAVAIEGWDFRAMDRRGPTIDPAGMEASQLVLTELLAMVALVAATIEYGEVIQRRARRRALAEAEADQRAIQEAGLRGMVRVFLAER
jgi:hypothetical protein